MDKTRKDAVLRGLLSSLSKEAYVTLPMSELMLFGRTQDYGYAQGDPVRVVASRHHFRLWRAPFTLDGHTVWAGAGTHDIGFDRDQRNGISPTRSIRIRMASASTSGSRSSRPACGETEYLRAAKTIETAKTAHGEEFHSDGRTLIIYLQPEIRGHHHVPRPLLFRADAEIPTPESGVPAASTSMVAARRMSNSMRCPRSTVC